jgi:hypothetical protein
VTDIEIHEAADAEVRRRFGADPAIVWDVRVNLHRDGFIVLGRASRAAYDLYCSRLRPEVYMDVRIDVVDP